MRWLLVTPASPGSLKGNRITALRWARRLREIGHKTRVVQAYDRQPCDGLIALHARRSAPSIRRFAAEGGRGPLIVALTGTDLYHDLRNRPRTAESLDLADRLVALQPLALRALARPSWQAKTRVIFQSATPLSVRRPQRPRHFDVCVLGHLRPVKDPFRAAMAVRRLPPDSSIRIVHVGEALTQMMRRRAQLEAARNPRYRWLGGLPRWRALRVLARSRLLVLSSLMEGGANAISEALANRVPIIASRIDGSVGILGRDYPGYFPPGDAKALARLLRRAESDRTYYGALKEYGARLRRLVTPAHERSCWRRLLQEVAATPHRSTE